MMPDKFTLEQHDVVLLIVDIQEKLAAVMSEKDRVVANALHLIELAKMLDIPVVVTEQYPKGLGATVAEIGNALPQYRPIEKMTFDCCGQPSFLRELQSLRKGTVILAGMETHICVLQTCIGLLRGGMNVHVVRDAVCSRSRENRRAGIGYMRQAGAIVTCTETALFQLLKVAGTDAFKAISRRIK